MWLVYILKCSDKTLYTGITNDLKKRISQHNSSSLGAKYTRGRRPLSLVYQKRAENKSEALQLELYIKRLSRKNKKLLIKNEKHRLDLQKEK